MNNRYLTVSQEFLRVQREKQLGVHLLALVEGLRAKLTDGQPLSGHDRDRVRDIIRDHTGMSINIVFKRAMAMPAAVWLLNSPQVGGVNYTDKPKSLDPKTLHAIMQHGAIDQRTGKVSDAFSRYPAEITLSQEVLAGKVLRPRDPVYTPEEITAMLLHEVGHLYTLFATIGDYAVLNYTLTEGVERTLGRQGNTTTTKIYNIQTLTENVEDEALKKRLKTDPSEEHVRQAYIQIHARERRHQMGESNSANMRGEQAADLYVGRQGFGRALATALYKCEKSSYWRYYMNPYLRMATEGLKSAVLVFAFHPITVLIYGIVEYAFVHQGRDNAYDKPPERLRKIRQELVGQSKEADLPESYQRELLRDIKAVDRLLKGMNEYPSLSESLVFVLFPGYRERRQLQAQEEILEELMNNDLFTAAMQLKHL